MLSAKEVARLKNLDVTEAKREILEVIANSGCIADTFSILSTAYILLECENQSNIDTSSFETFCSTSNIDYATKLFINKYCGALNWNLISKLIGRFDVNVLKSVILFHVGNETGYRAELTPTPIPVINIALNILNIDKGETVADYCTGTGNFIVNAYMNEADAKYSGFDIDTRSTQIAKIRAKILGGDIEIVQSNLLKDTIRKEYYDKVFANYPFIAKDINVSEDFKDIVPYLKKVHSSDWLFNVLLIQSIKPNGKAIGIMRNGCTWNSSDKDIRKYFVDNGYIEAVITFPEKIFPGMVQGMTTSMIVFSHGNKEITLVNAEDLCEKERRENNITSEYIGKICKAYDEPCEYSRRISVSEIAQNDYVINPKRFLSEEVTIKNGVRFKEIVGNITRGAQIKASELDELVSKEPTNYQYLMLANIKDGMIDEDLPYITGIAGNLEKYCLKNKNIILSKNSYPYKVAIANIDDGRKVLASGNLFIIEIDESKANPYYVKAFLESETGASVLNSVSVGTAMQNISKEALLNIKIPCPPIEKQNEFAMHYLAKKDEIDSLKIRLDKAKGTLKHMFDEKEVQY